MIGYIADFLRFLWAVINTWAGYTTGGIVMALLWFWSTLKSATIPRGVGITLALVFLLVAFFSAWREQYRRAEIAAEDVPDLRGWIDGVITGQMLPDNSGSVPGVLLVVSIKNLKMPSIVQGYACVARTPDGTSFQGQPQTVPPDMK